MAEQVFVYVGKTCAYDMMLEHELSEMRSDPCVDCKRDNSSFKEKSPLVRKHQTDYMEKLFNVSISQLREVRY